MIRNYRERLEAGYRQGSVAKFREDASIIEAMNDNYICITPHSKGFNAGLVAMLCGVCLNHGEEQMKVINYGCA